MSGAPPDTAIRSSWRPAARLGAASGLLAVSVSLALQLLGLPGLLQAVGGGLVVFTPGPVFGTLIDALQERGRPLLVLGTAVLLVVVAAGAAAPAPRAGRRSRRSSRSCARPFQRFTSSSKSTSTRRPTGR